ncbi:hypothetical protein LV79_002710 [Actinokineospora globicatena]|nr:hypothetical protein [Actinokineospora globicatena]
MSTEPTITTTNGYAVNRGSPVHHVHPDSADHWQGAPGLHHSISAPSWVRPRTLALS